MTYGCGGDDCMACYPTLYRCEACATDFDVPFDRTTGEKPPTCKRCGYDQINPDTIDLSVEAL